MRMGTVGLRELREDASELVRRVQAGEEFTITVAGPSPSNPTDLEIPLCSCLQLSSRTKDVDRAK
jgi:hypothetical protein